MQMKSFFNQSVLVLSTVAALTVAGSAWLLGCQGTASAGQGLDVYVNAGASELSQRLNDGGFSPITIDTGSGAGKLVSSMIGNDKKDFFVVVNPTINKMVTVKVLAPDVKWSAVETVIEELKKINDIGPKEAERLNPAELGHARLTVFSDYQCPFCRQVEDVVEQWESKYGEKLEVEFVNFPLPSHPLALSAAVAAECAKAQGKFEPFKKATFAAQPIMKTGKAPFEAIAKKLKMDTKALRACFEDKATQEKVQNDLFFGNYMAVKATPTLFLNGQPLENMGAPEIEAKIKEAIK